MITELRTLNNHMNSDLDIIEGSSYSFPLMYHLNESIYHEFSYFIYKLIDKQIYYLGSDMTDKPGFFILLLYEIEKLINDKRY